MILDFIYSPPPPSTIRQSGPAGGSGLGFRISKWRKKIAEEVGLPVLPPLPKPKQKMALWFTWTHNNPKEGDIDRHKSIFIKGGVSLEKGESGTFHLQGFGRVVKQCRITALKKLCKGCHFEVKKGSVQSNIEYISKDPLDGPHYWPSKEDLLEDDQGKRNDLHAAVATYRELGRVEAISQHLEVFAKYPRFETLCRILCEPKPMSEDRPLREWQQAFLDYVAANDNDRSIFWVHDAKGGAGKSTLARYLMDKGYIQLDGKVCDMAYMFDATAKGIIFDVARTKADSMDHIYQFAEKVKDGYIVSSKYESRGIKFPSKTVIIFSNFAPDHSKWSHDRLKYFCIRQHDDNTKAFSFTKGDSQYSPPFQVGSSFPFDIAFSS